MTGGPEGELAWRRASCDGGACVEVAALGKIVVVRSSVDSDTTFRMSRDEWREFLTSAKSGLFDEL